MPPHASLNSNHVPPLRYAPGANGIGPQDTNEGIFDWERRRPAGKGFKKQNRGYSSCMPAGRRRSQWPFPRIFDSHFRLHPYAPAFGISCEWRNADLLDYNWQIIFLVLNRNSAGRAGASLAIAAFSPNGHGCKMKASGWVAFADIVRVPGFYGGDM
jgi:hypothetical protein